MDAEPNEPSDGKCIMINLGSDGIEMVTDIGFRWVLKPLDVEPHIKAALMKMITDDV